jgi:hypothetical protein
MQPLFANALSKAGENPSKPADPRRATLARPARLIMPQGTTCLARLAAPVARPAQPISARHAILRIAAGERVPPACSSKPDDALASSLRRWTIALVTAVLHRARGRLSLSSARL